MSVPDCVCQANASLGGVLRNVRHDNSRLQPVHFSLMTLHNTCFPLALANVQLVLGAYPDVGLVLKGAQFVCAPIVSGLITNWVGNKDKHPLPLPVYAHINKRSL